MPKPRDTKPVVPAGYLTATELADLYKRSPQSIRIRMDYDNVPRICIPRVNAAGEPIGGHRLVAYPEQEAHAALSREDLRSRSNAPGYIGLLARAFRIKRSVVREALAAAGVASELRFCVCCGKPTLYYPDRTAAHAALCEYMRRYPLPPVPSTHPTTTP